MILTVTHMYDAWGGRYSILAYKKESWWLMERGWNFNMPNVSCVPRDEYILDPHHTTKYPHTWAVLGDDVSHGPEDGISRYACVFHRALHPIQLEGCLTVCKAINPYGATLGTDEAWDRVCSLFDSASGPIKILMTQ